MRINVLLFALLLLLGGCGTPVEGGILLKTADPAVGLFVPYVEAAAVAPVEPDPIAEELEEQEAEQVACDIKVNVSRSDVVYHLPGGAYYDRVKVDFAQGDFYACDEAEAIAAGARKSSR